MRLDTARILIMRAIRGCWLNFIGLVHTQAWVRIFRGLVRAVGDFEK